MEEEQFERYRQYDYQEFIKIFAELKKLATERKIHNYHHLYDILHYLPSLKTKGLLENNFFTDLEQKSKSFDFSQIANEETLQNHLSEEDEKTFMYLVQSLLKYIEENRLEEKEEFNKFYQKYFKYE